MSQVPPSIRPTTLNRPPMPTAIRPYNNDQSNGSGAQRRNFENSGGRGGYPPPASGYAQHQPVPQQQLPLPQPPLGPASVTSSVASAHASNKDKAQRMEVQGENQAKTPIPKNLPGGPYEGSVEKYEKICKIGEGTYGKVYKARSRENANEFYALKQIRMENEKEGFPITAIREIKILKYLQHGNVVKLKEVVSSKDRTSIYMVFEYMDHDLTGLQVQYGEHFSRPQIKCYMKQLLDGLFFCHSKGVLHRDIKGANLLINNKGQLKLADFGLARLFTEGHKYTNRVITLWYRPPELLLGATAYGPAIDIWSAGCILAELLNRRPLFPGKAEPEQLDRIFRYCGSPTDENWKDAKKLPHYDMMVKHQYKPKLKEVFKDQPPEAVDLLEKMLALDPAQRITAADALDHDFFWTDPMPAECQQLPQYRQACHDYQVKKRKAETSKQNPPTHPANPPMLNPNKRMRDFQGNPVQVANGAVNGGVALPKESKPF